MEMVEVEVHMAILLLCGYKENEFSFLVFFSCWSLDRPLPNHPNKDNLSRTFQILEYPIESVHLTLQGILGTLWS